MKKEIAECFDNLDSVIDHLNARVRRLEERCDAHDLRLDRVDKLEKRIVEKKLEKSTPSVGEVNLPRGGMTREANGKPRRMTGKERWMRENLRPGEVYAGIVLGEKWGTPNADVHVVVSFVRRLEFTEKLGLHNIADDYRAPSVDERRIIAANTNLDPSKAWVRTIPVE